MSVTTLAVVSIPSKYAVQQYSSNYGSAVPEHSRQGASKLNKNRIGGCFWALRRAAISVVRRTAEDK